MTTMTTSQQRSERILNDIFGTCQQVVKRKLNRSTVIDLTQASKIPRFDRHELTDGKVVARGGFAVIRSVQSINLDSYSGERRPSGSARSESSAHTAKTEKSASSGAKGSSKGQGSRGVLAENVELKKNRKYVVKELERMTSSTDQNAYMNGIVDLAMEAQYLASLNHPNILTLKGISTSNQFGGDDGMFLVLEFLPETLIQRLASWMQKDRSSRGVTGFVTGSRKNAQKLIRARLTVARDIAEAMTYLHSKDIIYRDIKPGNIGFNAEDEVKIFDFGLARECIKADRDANGLYRNMTGFTGALRYMAPEVALHKRYNLTADVYSFTMLLWQLMALEPPFGLYTPKMMVDRVFEKGYRPVIDEKWPEPVQALLRVGWNSDIKSRPSMSQVSRELRVIIEELGDGKP